MAHRLDETAAQGVPAPSAGRDPSRPRRAGRRGSPLPWSAPWWGVRQGPWSLLVLLVFTVLATASAAPPMFAEASENAAFESARAAVPAGARQSDADVVRLTASASPSSADQRAVLDEIRAIPGLSAPTLNGKSVAVELNRSSLWESFLGHGARGERARLFALPDPAEYLVPAGDGVAGRAGGGVWLPVPLARELGVEAGDPVTFSSRTRNGEERRVDTTVAGSYRVAEDGRRPLDPAGRRDWSLRRGELPPDSALETLPAYLVIGDVATAEALAGEVGDQMLWSVDAALAPGLTLAEARVVADRIDLLRKRYVQGRAEGEILARRVASGIGDLSEQAGDVAAGARRRTLPLEWAAVLVALISLVAVVAAALRRRDVELRHAVGAGTPTTLVALLWALEHLLPAALGGVLGWLCAWAIVGQVGPTGAVTALSVVPGLRFAAVSVAVGVVLVGAFAGAVAARRVRPAAPGAGRRRVPWLVLVVAAAVTATAGLAAADRTDGDARSTDLLVPLLVFVAAGALGMRLLPWLTRAGWRRPSRPARPTAGWLARRRLGAAVPGRAPVAAAVTAGLGMVLFALSAVASTRTTIEDRVAVRSGAETVAAIEAAWQLDDDPVLAPPRPKAGEPASDEPVPEARTPPLPARTTLVWRIDVTNAATFGTHQLLVVDPATLVDAASWGHGPELARARRALSRLSATDPYDPIVGLPAIAVGVDGVEVDDLVQVEAGPWRERLRIVDAVDVFPRYAGEPMYVVPAGPAFPTFGPVDPRLKPRDNLADGIFARTELWGASDVTVDAVLSAHGVQPRQLDTATQLRRRDIFVAAEQAGGYQLAVAGYLALLAVLALCVHAQRRAAADRPTDLMLARLGFGRSRVLLSRAVEQAALAALALLCAVAGLLLLSPLAGRLLDVAPDEAPAFRLVVTPAALGAATLAALLAAGAATAVSGQRSGRGEEEAYRTDA
ncbi:hypothetical protein [Micromonospora narathiwatensis]|uniref:Putative ABC transport system permease protein n=1 Tax=Micromonospora narathiwatensis TaxID=299146 RepID=A0A1A8ZLT9_9ACTN|nr:hypothetical protein [Micromonospora narathiwatensis]SBT44822.1 putative ABC transport system permease protein [Micromonospora narathiwatensis]